MQKGLLRQYDLLPGNAYSSNLNFRKNFTGFAVVPDQDAGNALIRINLADTNTKLVIVLHQQADFATKRDTAVSYFRFNLSGGVATFGKC